MPGKKMDFIHERERNKMGK
uniref:Uncharacterized protein n=1 Tax=Rhizophora mucronata TaxID=61149 RepID=A0A2P2PF68_RHIMU